MFSFRLPGSPTVPRTFGTGPGPAAVDPTEGHTIRSALRAAIVPCAVLVVSVAAFSAFGEEPDVVDPFEVMAALDRAAEMRLWPGFDPSSYPVAIFDGSRTLLFRHPGPPDDFHPLENRPGVWAFDGKHPAMRWNSNAEIGGVATATLLLTIEPGRPVDYEAHILFHEIFHLYSRPIHPTWRPNEVWRYSYPMDDLENYRMLLLEEEALARAVEAESDDLTAAWAAAALEIRGDRLARLDDEHRAYEIALELQEGTAVYMGRSTIGTATDMARLRESRGPQGIRWRCYETGAAVAVILDRLMPSWKAALDAEPATTFADLLAAAIAENQAPPAVLTNDEVEEIAARARAEVATLVDERRALRESFERRGSRVVVRLPDDSEPFRLERFDPMAVEVLSDGRALQAHRLVARHPQGEVRLENPHFVRGSLDGVIAMTEPAGEHPFLEGLRLIAVTGFTGQPAVTHNGDNVKIEAEGLTVELKGATVEATQTVLIVTLLPGAARALPE